MAVNSQNPEKSRGGLEQRQCSKMGKIVLSGAIVQ